MEFSFSYAENFNNMHTNWIPVRWLSYSVYSKIKCVELDVKFQKFLGAKLCFYLVFGIKTVLNSFNHVFSYRLCKGENGCYFFQWRVNSSNGFVFKS
jgi:hypothetical protein